MKALLYTEASEAISGIDREKVDDCLLTVQSGGKDVDRVRHVR